MLIIDELLACEEGKTQLIAMNSKQTDFLVASELFAKHGKLIDMNNLANMGTLQKHQEIL
nr:hypothetical protein [Tissierellia bacterium]